ncbi:MAG: hypothetical protein V1908_01760 [Candidatus Peregrinibacteria bacterium]
MKTLYHLFFAIALLLALLNPVQASQMTYQIQGAVRLSDSKPAVKIAVQLMDQSGRVLQETQTKATGRYGFSNVILDSGQSYFIAIEMTPQGQVKKPIDLKNSRQIIDFDYRPQIETRVDFAYWFWADGTRGNSNSVDIDDAFLITGTKTERAGLHFDSTFDFKGLSPQTRHHRVVDTKDAHFWLGTLKDGKLGFFTREKSGVVRLITPTSRENDIRYALPFEGYQSEGVTVKEDTYYAIHIAEINRYAMIYVNLISKSGPSSKQKPTLKPDRHSFHGQVMDEKEISVSQVPVGVMDEEGEIVAETKSDKNGYYELWNVKLNSKGSYFLVADPAHFSDYILPIRLAEKEQNRNIKLYYPRIINVSFKYNLDHSPSFSVGGNYQRGFLKLVSGFDDGDFSGVDLKEGIITPADKGMVHVEMDSKGVLRLEANNLGGGGIVDLGQVAGDFGVDTIPPSLKKQEVEIKTGHAYGIYDKNNNNYGFIKIKNIRLDLSDEFFERNLK